ncbi:MAG: DUF3575 domain-containing protein [Oscillospiraceae bacterium]|nr:DUF3575 domain-containing protein [Oscillospiraceae bacterium]
MMLIQRHRQGFCAFVLLLLAAAGARAQQPAPPRDTLRVLFPRGSAVFDPGFGGNAERIRAFDASVQSRLHSADTLLVSVGVSSSASPEGTPERNAELARERGAAVEAWLRRTYPAVGTVALTSGTELPPAGLDASEYARYRMAFVSFTYSLSAAEADSTYLLQSYHPQPEREPENIFAQTNPGAVEEETPSAEPGAAGSYTIDTFLKTNLLGWPLLAANLGAEWQVAEHLSLGFIAYYTALDWFAPTTKFRVLGIQPELRWWFRPGMTGWFVGAHATFGWYNIAWFGSDYRYQDHHHDSPTLGGGLSGGYKLALPWGRQGRWGLEFSLGAGVLPLHYDIYYNVENGRRAGEAQKTYVGIDNASVTLTWRVGRDVFDKSTKKKRK